MRNMDILRRCDVENPYKTCDGCKGGTECGEMANCRDLSLAWEGGFKAGLEAAALESDRVAAVHDDWARQPHALPATRAVATAMRILAHEIRNMKGNNQ